MEMCQGSMGFWGQTVERRWIISTDDDDDVESEVVISSFERRRKKSKGLGISLNQLGQEMNCDE